MPIPKAVPFNVSPNDFTFVSSVVLAFNVVVRSSGISSTLRLNEPIPLPLIFASKLVIRSLGVVLISSLNLLTASSLALALISVLFSLGTLLTSSVNLSTALSFAFALISVIFSFGTLLIAFSASSTPLILALVSISTFLSFGNPLTDSLTLLISDWHLFIASLTFSADDLASSPNTFKPLALSLAIAPAERKTSSVCSIRDCA